MLPAYISAVIQSTLNPENIFDLVLKHRQFVMLFGFTFNFLLILRFGLPAFLFFLFFEVSKFYIFGDRFLGENLVVYPLVYLLFLSWEKLNKMKIKKFDLIFTAIFAWLVIFLRETFIPVAIFLFLFIALPVKRKEKVKIYSLLLLLVLSVGSLISVNFKDYYFNIFEANKVFFAQNSNQSLNMLFYPLLILTSNKWNIFRILLVGIDVLFISSLLYLVLKRNFKFLFLLIPLMLANIRVVEPGRIFYESFHMVPFYGLFLSSAFLLVGELRKHDKKIFGISLLVILFLFLSYVLSPHVFFREKANQHEEFITNYGNILQVGSVIKILSKEDSKIFIDGFDEAIYWVSQSQSSYKYSMYTSIMPNFKIFSDARLQMFKKNPPDYYYGSCPKEKNLERLMPNQFGSQYVRLNAYGKPSCIFVKEDRIKDITIEQWKKAKEFGYELP